MPASTRSFTKHKSELTGRVAECTKDGSAKDGEHDLTADQAGPFQLLLLLVHLLTDMSAAFIRRYIRKNALEVTFRDVLNRTAREDEGSEVSSEAQLCVAGCGNVLRFQLFVYQQQSCLHEQVSVRG